MKVKTIKATLRQKIDEWIKTIDDDQVKELVKKNTLVTGGCIASMLLREPVNDYDIYFRNKETVIAVATYYVKKFAKEQAEKKKKKAANGDSKDQEIQGMLKASGLKADKSGKISNTGAPEAPPVAPPTPSSPHEFQNGWICHHDTHTSDKNAISLRVMEGPNGRVRIAVQSAGVVSAQEGDYSYFEMDPDGEDAGDYIDSCFEGNEFQKRKPNTYAPLLITDNAITLSDDIQLVLRFYGDPAEIHEFYDFVHCTNYWTSDNNEVVVNPAALESLLTRELRYIGSQYPICSIIRIRKFLKRGWTINAGQIFKMCVQMAAMVTPQPMGKNWFDADANNLMLENVPLMQEQLVGVDTAYFREIINKLKNPPDPEKGKTLDQTYLFNLIDEIF